MATDADVMAEMKRQFEWASRELANKEQEHAALVAQRDRLRDALRVATGMPDRLIEEYSNLAPGDLGEGGAE